MFKSSRPPELFLRAMLVMAGMAVGSAALAHHSFAMFDVTRETKITGTVTEFSFQNPHTNFRLDVVQKPGQKPVSYFLEGPTPVILRRLGWTQKTLQPGMRVTVLVHPLRDKKPGGHAIRLWLENGKELSLTAEDVSYKATK